MWTDVWGLPHTTLVLGSALNLTFYESLGQKVRIASQSKFQKMAYCGEKMLQRMGMRPIWLNLWIGEKVKLSGTGYWSSLQELSELELPQPQSSKFTRAWAGLLPPWFTSSEARQSCCPRWPSGTCSNPTFQIYPWLRTAPTTLF
jgi:hypothetical protein